MLSWFGHQSRFTLARTVWCPVWPPATGHLLSVDIHTPSAICDFRRQDIGTRLSNRGLRNWPIGRPFARQRVDTLLPLRTAPWVHVQGGRTLPISLQPNIYLC